MPDAAQLLQRLIAAAELVAEPTGAYIFMATAFGTVKKVPLVQFSRPRKAGLIAYIDVVVVQATALSNERTVLTLLGSRLTASVQLIAALGGGWQGLPVEE